MFRFRECYGLIGRRDVRDRANLWHREFGSRGGAPHLEKLRAGNMKLTAQEKSELATFISLMRTRTRSYREVNTIASKMHVLMAKATLETSVEDLIEKNRRARQRASRGGAGARRTPGAYERS